MRSMLRPVLSMTLVSLVAGCAVVPPQARGPVGAPYGQPVPPAYGYGGGSPGYGQPVPPAPGYGYGPPGRGDAGQYAEIGTVQSIDLVRAESQTSGGGALLGGVIGAVAGRQLGSGSGRTAGTAIGAVAGALIGNQIERQNRGARDVYRVAIRTDRGDVRAFDYATLADLRVGDRVRIDGGQVYRY